LAWLAWLWRVILARLMPIRCGCLVHVVLGRVAKISEAFCLAGTGRRRRRPVFRVTLLVLTVFRCTMGMRVMSAACGVTW
jgi:hypothetical protein